MKICKKIFLMFAVIIITLSTAGIVHAETEGDISNVIIFAKFSDDNLDIFNAEYTVTYSGGTQRVYRNWDNIKSMYDKSEGQNCDNSFKNYISIISEGKINVTNIFPQESADGKSVNTYTLESKKSEYSSSDMIVSEVLAAIKSGRIKCDFKGAKLDNLQSGYIDNLTVIVQGATEDSDNVIYPHKTQYAGNGDINGLKVYFYNTLPSGSLVTDDASLGVRQQQGVISHEFLHVLGMPDLYRRSGNGVPVGAWDIMAVNSQFLQYPLSYLRAEQGWIDINWIDKPGTYTLTAVSESGGNKLFGIKTPLSDTEYIMLEYRKKNSDNYFALEHAIPSTGLLMYRVDTKIEDYTNIRGENYLYVYRPDVTDPEAGTDVYTSGDYSGRNKVYGAAIEPDKNETGYGSTDLSATYKDNTLYYSDGSNSGVAISNAKLSADKSTVTFDISFADYENAGLWDKVGSGIASEVTGKPYMLYSDNDVYAAYTVTDANAKSMTRVSCWDGSRWSSIGGNLDGITDAVIAENLDNIYLSGVNYSNGHLVNYRMSGGSWVKVSEINTNYPQGMQLTNDGSNLYVSYQENVSGMDYKYVICNLKTGAIVNEELQAKNFANPVIAKQGNVLYLLYSDFFGSDGRTTLKAYDISAGTWTTIKQFDTQKTNIHSIYSDSNAVYMLMGKAGSNPVYAVYKDGKCTQSIINVMRDYVDVSLDILNNNAYVTYTDTQNNQVFVLKGTDGAFTLYDDKLGIGYSSLATCNSGNDLYVALVTQNSGKLQVCKKRLEDSSEQVKKEGLTLDYDGVWRYYNNGQFMAEYSGMAYANKRWWYVENGLINFSYTGMTYGNGRWWYFSNGAIDFKYTGMVYGNGRWWYFNNGAIDFKYTGMAYYKNRWWYFSNGAIDFKYTGTAYYKQWWYFSNGAIDFKYTGMAYANNNWWYFSNGSINFKYTGIGQNKGGKWYFQNGQIAWRYSGTVVYNGKSYKVTNGKVTG